MLTTPIEPGDRIEVADKSDRRYLASALGAIVNDPRTLYDVVGADAGVYTLRLALGLAD